MSSRLVQVTVWPTFTVSWAGSNTKLSIWTAKSSARAALAGSSMVATTAMPKSRRLIELIATPPSALQRRIDDRKPLVALPEIDAGDPKQAAQLAVFDLHWAGRGGRAWRRLREGRRARGVEGYVALHLLHHLVDVTVQHGDRAESLEIVQRAGAILGAPAPLRIDRPQRDMGEQHDRRGFR